MVAQVSLWSPVGVNFHFDFVFHLGCPAGSAPFLPGFMDRTAGTCPCISCCLWTLGAVAGLNYCHPLELSPPLIVALPSSFVYSHLFFV